MTLPLLALASLTAPLAMPAPAQGDTAAQEPVSQHRILETQANTFRSNNQIDPALAADAQGNVVVAWGSRRQEQGTFGIFAELVDPLGRHLSLEMHVNQFLPREQAQPAVAIDANGDAWISWHSVGQDGNGVSVYARRFEIDADAATPEERLKPLGDEFRVNDLIGATCHGAVIAAADDGQVLAVWNQTQEDGQEDLMGRLFTHSGEAVGASFRLDVEHLNGTERLASVVGGQNDFLAAWARINRHGTPESIQGARIAPRQQAAPFAADAALPSAVCQVFAIASGDDAFVIEPSIDRAADGSFVVAWMSSQNGDTYEVMAQRFGADGIALAKPMVVEAGGSDSRSGVQVAVAPDGRFVVTYNVHEAKIPSGTSSRPGRAIDIRAQRFAADGTAMDSGFQLNQVSEGEQTMQVGINAKHLLWTAQDQIVAAWHGNTGQDGRGIGLSMVVPEGLQVPAPAPFEPLAAASALTSDQVHGDSARPIYNPFFVAGPYTPPPPAAGGIGGFEAIQNTGWTPPDPDLAVGPNHIVCVANGEISFFDKSGVQSFSQAIAGGGGFWGSVGAGGFVFDPIALYDPHDDRYIVAAADGAGSNDAIVIAMSDDNDPNGTWYKYRFVVSGTCGFLDFPNMGVSRDAIFMSGDCFAGGGNRIFMWDKSQVKTGAAVTMKQLQSSSGLISLGATKNYDNTDTGYFASTYSSSSTKLMIKAVTTPNGTPVLHQREITVPFFTFPPDADQLGTSNKASTIDFRVKNGVVRNGSLWVAHNTGESSTARVRWLEIDLNGWPTSGSNPTLTQSGTLDYGNGDHNWFPDINVADNGTAVIAFNRSSSSQYISVEYVTRKATDAAGFMTQPEQLQISTSPENGSRWGDYAGLEQDPVRPNVFWSHHEYRTSSWRTWVGEILAEQQIALTVTPLTQGLNSFWTVTQANPSEVVYFLVSLQPGSFSPPQLGGLALDLGSPVTVVGNALTSAQGAASINITVPPSAPLGAQAHIQAAIIRGVGGVDSVKSNLIVTTIQ